MGAASFAVLSALFVVLLQFSSCSASPEKPLACTPGFSSDTYVFTVYMKKLRKGHRLGRVVFSDCTDRHRFVFNTKATQFVIQTDGMVTVKRDLVLHDGHKNFSVHTRDPEGNKFTVPVGVYHQRHHGHHHDEQDHGHHQDHGQQGQHHSDQHYRQPHDDQHLRHHRDGNHHDNHHQGHHQHEHHQTQSSAVTIATDAPSRHKREIEEEDVPVIYFPKATEGLKRRKRDWVLPPFVVGENSIGPFPQHVCKIHSNNAKGKIIYSITGPGADLPPVNLFFMNPDTGIMYLTQPLDRETQANYSLLAHAVAEGGGPVEEPMDLIVKVFDQNDNKPIFIQTTFIGEVAESSPPGFDVIKVEATDADDPGTTNAIIRYSILSQDPQVPHPDMFSINPVSGVIRVNAKGLDREKNPKYTLKVQAADLVGEGLTGFCTVILSVTDSNDNAPIFTQQEFEASVEENTKDALVVKMLVTDKDDAHTPAWNAKFTIVDGDRDGLFTVVTGANKQEGIITTAKGLDFEKVSKYTLLVAAENDVPFAVPLLTSTATVTVTVIDVNEAPIFDPAVKLISKSEDLAVDTDIVPYTAYDPDTARKQTVHYRMLSDPAGWLNVDQDTGMVTVKAPMDREHLLVKNDIYVALIGAYDNDEIPATGTGTLQIKLEDVNDNAPTIFERNIRVCHKESGSRLLAVTDKDGPGFSSPFKVELEGSSKKNWTAKMNGTGTGIVLELVTELDPGNYQVQLRVADTEGLDQLSTVEAEVCACTGPDVQCEARIAGGPPLPIILGVLAGILLLLSES